MVVPLSAVVSRTGITEVVALRAEVMFLAMREREEGRSDLHLAPGLRGGCCVSDMLVDFGICLTYWKLYNLIPSCSQRCRSSRKVLYALLAFSGSSSARLTRYEPWGRMHLVHAYQ